MSLTTTSGIRAARGGSVIPLISASLVALVLLGGGIYWFFSSAAGEAEINPILSSVVKTEFVAKVLDQGEIQSAENVEIKCQVGSRNGEITVIDVIPEGTMVKSGDWLVTLDSTAFEKELEQQRIAVTNAETAVIQAQAAFDAAVASKKEYEEGLYVEQKKQIENEKFSAEQELEQAQAYLVHSIKLQKKGFITRQQLRSDEIAVDKARNSLELAEKKLDVLENITFPKEIKLLQSDIRAAEVKLQNDIEAKKIEQNQLEEIEEQLRNCEIVVPDGVSGEVVFAKEFDRRGGSEWILEPGATVRERQPLIRLPNREKMEVKVLINEQSITAIAPNMPASIVVDAMAGKSLKGVVTKVNSYAEPGGWMSSSAVREYAVFVRILDPPTSLIPGMNASVTVQTMYEPDALQIPLQCIYAVNDDQFVLRKSGEQWETVKVEIGGENSQNVWIKSGIEEGDLLAMNPGAYKNLMDLPELKTESRIELPEGTVLTSIQAGGPDAAMDGAGGSMRPPGGPDGRRGERGGPGSRGERGGDERGGRGGQRGGGGGFSVDSIVDRTMERYDANGDDKIDEDERAEVDERMRDRLADADSDGDGAISREELKSGMEAMFQRMQQGGGFGGGGGVGGNATGRGGNESQN